MRVLTVVVGLMLLAGCGSDDTRVESAEVEPTSTAVSGPSASPSGTGATLMQVRGAVTITGNVYNAYLSSEDGTCTGWHEYDDIGIGTQVIITNAGGETIALGELGLPLMQADDPADPNRACVIDLEVRGVPRGEGFYRVQIGEREPVDFAEDDMGRVAIAYP